jgi:imidazolonepropionase-like amidohydrolase
MLRSSGPVAAILLALVPDLAAQQLRELSPNVRQYVSVDAPTIALTNLSLIDGTGAALKTDQTILVSGGKITWVGDARTAKIPTGARTIQLAGHTVIPGMVGLHNHTFYYTAAPRATQSNYTAPMLYLGAGVTTIRTTGSASPYAELNLKANIDRGELPGPRLFVTGPYLIGPGPDMRLDLLGMHELPTPAMARKVVDYWAEEGASWLKIYTQIDRATFKAITEQAHARGMKVTGHLCSIGYREAVALGIDGLEHGLLANSEYFPDKKPDLCPGGFRDVFSGLDIAADPRVRATMTEMLNRKVAMTSTLAVYEASTPGRRYVDPRLWDVLSPDARVEEENRQRELERAAKTSPMAAALKKSMEFEVAFFRAGGLLGAGVDPAWSTPAGLGDHRNYELLIEAGLTAAEAIKVMTLNGAKILGIDDRLGSIAAGKVADLVVIRGDPAARPAEIRAVTLVFRDGIGYDSAKLLAATKGLVGIR